MIFARALTATDCHRPQAPPLHEWADADADAASDGGGGSGGSGGGSGGAAKTLARPLRAAATKGTKGSDAFGGEAAVTEGDTSSALQWRHRAVSAAFSARATGGFGGTAGAVGGATPSGDRGGGIDERTPLLITFEDMARGLHFEAVEAVFILGMPDSPATYLHLAGRTGRQGRAGSVVTVCPGAAFEQLVGWSQRLGGIQFEELVSSKGAEGVGAGGEGAAVADADALDAATAS